MRRWFKYWGFFLIEEFWPLVVTPLVAEYCMRNAGWAWYWHVVIDITGAITFWVFWDWTAYAAGEDGDWNTSLLFGWRKDLSEPVRSQSAD
jgi:hypothetical protein